MQRAKEGRLRRRDGLGPVRMQHGEDFARLHALAGLLFQDDTRREVDHVLLRLAACAEQGGRFANFLRVHVGKIAAARRENFMLDRGLRELRRVIEDGGIAALRRDPALHLLECTAGGNGFLDLRARRLLVPAVAEHEHVGREHGADLLQIGAALATEDLDGLFDLERVADPVPERDVHIRQNGSHIPATGLADRHHVLGQLTPGVQRLHERAGADLDVEHDRM